MLSIMLLLPTVLRTGLLVTKLLAGKASDQEFDSVVQEVVDLLKTIPQLQGIMGIISMVMPIIRAILLKKTDPNIADVFKAEGISRGDLEVAAKFVEFFDAVTDEAVRQGIANMKKVDNMSPADVFAQVEGK